MHLSLSSFVLRDLAFTNIKSDQTLVYKHSHLEYTERPTLSDLALLNTYLTVYNH